jgi:DNA-directed RNA polymerase specialized sigma24 family protein
VSPQPAVPLTGEQRQWLGQIVQQHWGRFCGLVRHLLAERILQPQGASGLVQEAVGSVLRGIHSGTVRAGDERELTAFLWTVLRRKCYDVARGEVRLTVPLLEEGETGVPVGLINATDEQLDAHGLEVSERLHRLDDIDRAILLLDSEGESDLAISDRLGLLSEDGRPSRDQVKRRRSRALRALRLSYGLCWDCLGEIAIPPAGTCPHCHREWHPLEVEMARQLLPAAVLRRGAR